MTNKVLETTDIKIFEDELANPHNRTWVKVNGLNHIYILKVRSNIISEKMMFYCGYVGVPKSHPYFGVEYDTPDSFSIPAHCGLTYSSYMDEYDRDYWFFGFDCGHGGDSSSVEDLSSENPCTFKTFEFAKDGVFSMYEHLAQVDSDEFIVKAIKKERER